jgi:tetratricopeptide (TPR) repeat protein
MKPTTFVGIAFAMTLALGAAASATTPPPVVDVHGRVRATQDIPPAQRSLAQRLQLAKDLLVTERFDESLVEATAATVAYPNAAQAWIVKGDVLLAHRRYADALKDFDQAARLDRDSAEAQRGRGHALFSLGKGREADAANSLSNTLKRRDASPARQPL